MLHCPCQADFLPGWMCTDRLGACWTAPPWSVHPCTASQTQSTAPSLAGRAGKLLVFRKVSALWSVFTAQASERGWRTQHSSSGGQKTRQKSKEVLILICLKAASKGLPWDENTFEIWVHLSNDLRSLGCMLLVFLSIKDKQSLPQALRTAFHNCREGNRERRCRCAEILEQAALQKKALR